MLERSSREFPPHIARSNQRNTFLMNCAASIDVARYAGPIDDKIINACTAIMESHKTIGPG